MMSKLRDDLVLGTIESILDWKMAGFEFEYTLARAGGVTLDQTRFMIAFLMTCITGIILRRTPTAIGAFSHLG